MAAIPLLLFTGWLYTSQVTRRTLPTFRNKRICLLIAHPDDEAMFFSPTITALTAPDLENHLKILCLSSGDADGLGETRKGELAVSAVMLGLRAANDVLVLEDEAFPDSMTATWPTAKITQVLSSAFAPSATQGHKKTPPEAKVDVIITFDKHGVSDHPNHKSLYYGARAWALGILKGKEGWKNPVEMYTLTSTNIARKYMSFLDATITLSIGAFRGLRAGKKRVKEEPPSLVFISSYDGYRKGQKAMTQGHKTQMRWFRWAWICIGRYMIVNDLKREYV